jgi:hypothetical protein
MRGCGIEILLEPDLEFGRNLETAARLYPLKSPT